MRLACSTASFPEDRLQIAVAKVAWAGYDGVELEVSPAALPEVEAVRPYLVANELELVAVRAGVLPADAGEGAWEVLAGVGRAGILGRALDSSLVIVEAPPEATIAGLFRALGLLDHALGEAAITVCVVNRSGTALETRENLAELWGRGLPARIGIALDPGHALLAGWNPGELDALPQLPRHVYLNDASAGRIVPPCEGDLDLPALVAALKLRGYSGAVTLLLENANPWAVEPTAMEARAAAENWVA